MEALRKNQMAIVNIKNTVIVMNAFHDLISRLSIAEERISELEDDQQKLLKNRKRRKNREKNTPKQNRACKSSRTISHGLTF